MSPEDDGDVLRVVVQGLNAGGAGGVWQPTGKVHITDVGHHWLA